MSHLHLRIFCLVRISSHDAGNPIVYRGAIERIQGQPEDGAPVVVTDWKDCAIAWGVYNGTCALFNSLTILMMIVRLPKDASPVGTRLSTLQYHKHVAESF